MRHVLSILGLFFGVLALAQNYGNAYYTREVPMQDTVATMNDLTKGDYFGKLKKAKPELYKSVKNIMKDAIAGQSGTVRFVLSFNKDSAVYYWDNSQKEELPFAFKKTLDTIFFDNQKNEVLEQMFFEGLQFRAKTPLANLDWEITDEHKVIQGYKCTKAITTTQRQTLRGVSQRTHVAWFTRELPYPYGPMGMGGLPGLIVRLNDFYTLERIDFEPPKQPIRKPKKGKAIDKDEMFRNAAR